MVNVLCVDSVQEEHDTQASNGANHKEIANVGIQGESSHGTWNSVKIMNTEVYGVLVFSRAKRNDCNKIIIDPHSIGPRRQRGHMPYLSKR